MFIKFFKYATVQSGQSLVEFVILVPLFFIVLSGINLYLNQHIKSLTENSAYESLLIADSVFDSSERVQANWNSAHVSTNQYNNEIINHSLNSSEYFNKSVDMKDDVFFDKKKIQTKITHQCTKNPVYQLNEIKSGGFKFTSCANSNGFERSAFSYQNIQKNFKNIEKKYSGQSIYYPNTRFAWSYRKFTVFDAVKNFQISREERIFQKSYASLKFPVDQSEFNGKCFMNSNSQQCLIPALTNKWKRAAFDGANTQIFECFAEASAKCLKAVSPIAVAGCVLERTTEIAAALAMGQKSSVCPILNKITETVYKGVLVKSKIYNTSTLTNESVQRMGTLTYLNNEIAHHSN